MVIFSHGLRVNPAAAVDFCPLGKGGSLLSGSMINPEPNRLYLPEGRRSVPNRDVSRLRCPKCARVARKPFSYKSWSWVRAPMGRTFVVGLARR